MAHVDYFLKIPGVEGESTDEAHGGEIEISSWSWGEVNDTTIESGTSGGGAGRVVMQDFTFTMRMNKATPTLMIYCAGGTHIPGPVVLTTRRAGDKPQEYFFIRMKNVYVSSYQTGGSSGNIVPEDVVSLSFGEIEFGYKPQVSEKGDLGAEIKAGWDVQKNVKK